MQEIYFPSKHGIKKFKQRYHHTTPKVPKLIKHIKLFHFKSLNHFLVLAFYSRRFDSLIRHEQNEFYVLIFQVPFFKISEV